MNAPDLFFYFFAILAIFGALSVILARNPLYNVLSLVLVIFSLSSIFVLLEAFFVGIILMLVYAGAVLVFFIFVVMCLNLTAPQFTSQEQSRFKLFGIIAGGCFFAGFAISLKSFFTAQQMGASSLRGTIENIGQVLFTDYLLPFELTSLLLLVAVFGIVSLTKGVLNTK